MRGRVGTSHARTPKQKHTKQLISTASTVAGQATALHLNLAVHWQDVSKQEYRSLVADVMESVAAHW